MGKCGMELELDPIALLPSLYIMHQVPGITSSLPSNQPREAE